MTNTSTTITAQKVTAEIIIENMNDPEPRIIVKNSDVAHEHTLSFNDVNDIVSISYQLGSKILDFINNTRINEHHPLTTPLGQESLKPLASVENPDYEVENFAHVTSLVPVGTTDLTFDGIPVLEWSIKNSETIASRNRFGARINTALDLNPEHGWRLYLTGAEKSTISFASWNNLEGIQNLIRQTQDPESLLIVSGITDPETTSTLTSRLNAREILEERTIKKITLKPLKKIMQDNGYSTPENDSRNSRVLMRVLSIKFGKKNLPVACAILAPNSHEMEKNWEKFREENFPELDQPSHRAQLYSQKKDFLQQERIKWKQGLSDVINASPEWRIIDLPAPDLGWRYREREYLWATPLNEETWSVIQKAAELEAPKTSMNRGAVF